MFLPYRNRRAKITALLVLSCIVVLPSVSDSLWDEGAPGLLAGSASLQTGDTILVNIDINQDLSYDSSRIDSERVSIELSGGDGGQRNDRDCYGDKHQARHTRAEGLTGKTIHHRSSKHAS